MTRKFILILCISVAASPAFAQDPYRLFLANRFDYNLSAHYFKSTANFDANGGKQDLISGASLQSIAMQTSARYTFFDRAGLFAGVDFNNVDSNNGVQLRTNSRMTYLNVGLDLSLYKNDSWNLFAEGLFKKSNEEIDVNQDEALASDGADEIIGKVTGNYTGESFRSFASLGGNYRNNGLSTLLVYAFGADYRFTNLRFGLNFEGLSTVRDDENTATPISRDLLTTRVNAGSRRYYSVNPNYLEGRFEVAYNLDKNLLIAVYAGSSLIGSNSAQGLVAGAALNWGFGIDKKTFKTYDTVVEPDPNSPAVSEPGFKVDTNDGVNQDLFQNVQPVPADQKK